MSSLTTMQFIGADVLRLVTSGMYDDPMVIFREYIQNSVDAFLDCPWAASARVDISLDVGSRCVRIRDNGPGLSYEDALRDLVPIARSRKSLERHAGFRGIGRLAGLAFAERIEFYSRSHASEEVTRVCWDGAALRNAQTNSMGPENVWHQAVTVSRLSGERWPDHFFEVRVIDVPRFASSRLLNSEAIRRYIGAVCPVQLSHEFPFFEQVEAIISEHVRVPTVIIRIDGEDCPVTRQYGGFVSYSGQRSAPYVGFELFSVPSVDGTVDGAVGWLAHSEYDGAIPKHNGLRGLRARSRNFAVGGEKVFDHLFAEERFNRWCVGELHVLDPRIVPNARRDYFEVNPHLRNLENHLGAVVRGIVKKCRQASRARYSVRREAETVAWASHAYDLAVSGLLSDEYSGELARLAVERLEDLRSDAIEASGTANAMLASIHDRLSHFRPKGTHELEDRIGAVEAASYRRVFEAVADVVETPSVAISIIRSVLSQLYSKDAA